MNPSPTPPPSPPPNNRLSAWARTFEALQHKSFRRLWWTTLLLSGGNWIQQVTLGWLAYHLSGSALQVSLVLGLRALPLLLAPVAGVIADRFDRRNVLLMDQAILAVLAVGFAVDLLMGWEQLWHLYVFTFTSGVFWSINNPVRQTLVANSVPRESLMNAVALNSMAFNSMRTIGPAFGGFLIAFFGPGLNFLIQAVLYVAVFFVMVPYNPLTPTDRAGTLKRSPLANLVDGFRYVGSHRTILTIILVGMVPSLTMLSFVMTLMPVFAAEVLGDGEGKSLGLLMTAMGIGGFIGTVLIARFSSIEAKGRLVLISFLVAAVTMLVFAQTRSLALAMAVLILQQSAAMGVMTTNNTILQSITPDHMRGRVMGVFMMDIGLMPLGGVIAGAVADGFGVPFALIAGAVTGIAILGVITIFTPSFRRLRV